MLKLIDITKEYVVDKDEEKVLALNKVSIEFRKNEFVSILGPSGCGKTTLLNIIGGLDRYTSGDIQIDGVSTKDYDDVDWDTYRNRRIGFVFQSYNLIPHMNILKNVAMSLTLAGVEKEERKRRALEALEKWGLPRRQEKSPISFRADRCNALRLRALSSTIPKSSLRTSLRARWTANRAYRSWIFSKKWHRTGSWLWSRTIRLLRKNIAHVSCT